MTSFWYSICIKNIKHINIRKKTKIKGNKILPSGGNKDIITLKGKMKIKKEINKKENTRINF